MSPVAPVSMLPSSRQAMRFGAYQYLAKPFQPEEVLAVLREITTPATRT